MQLDSIKALIRDVPDFPQEGIVFKDITPLLADELAFSTVIDLIVVHFGRGNVDKVVGIEARGFILASPGRVPLRRGVRARAQGRASCPGRPSPRSTRWSTGPRRSRCTRMPSRRASAC